jgi:Ni,Fe-hydrogenase III small subunit/NAD-dependent dihydropyrimidine dehydrogenase PreA subunit
MLETFKARIHQGYQAIPDIRKATVKESFRGLPFINRGNCTQCGKCSFVCPTGAIGNDYSTIDMGKCVFCGDCEKACVSNAIKFTNFHKIAASSCEKLIVTPETSEDNYKTNAITASAQIKKTFGRSLKLRQVSAGGCNGCEMELNACSNVNFDMGRFGVEVVASPRHADGLLITGPITQNMAVALEDAYLSTPDPKIVILAGACAISGGVFQESSTLNREFLERHKVDLFIPGCPVHPLTVINGILDLIS